MRPDTHIQGGMEAMTTERRASATLRVVAVAAAAALALAIGACGGSDDGGGGDPDTGAGGTKPVSTEIGGSPEQQIKKTYDLLVKYIYSGQGERACDLMTPRIQRFFERSGKTTDSCAAFWEKIRSKLPKDDTRPRILSLKVNGNKAVAQTKHGQYEVYPVPFVKRDGEWRMNGGISGN
jgi:hypothetical protein